METAGSALAGPAQGFGFLAKDDQDLDRVRESLTAEIAGTIPRIANAAGRGDLAGRLPRAGPRSDRGLEPEPRRHSAISLPEVTEGRRIALGERSSREENGGFKKYTKTK